MTFNCIVKLAKFGDMQIIYTMYARRTSPPFQQLVHVKHILTSACHARQQEGKLGQEEHRQNKIVE
jgi:hypothetical protein